MKYRNDKEKIMYISYIKRKRNRNIEDFRKRIFIVSPSCTVLISCKYKSNMRL